MKKLMLQIMIVVFPVFAGNVSIPNIFTAGTPAVASEVNENFDALSTAINDNNNIIMNLEAKRVLQKVTSEISGENCSLGGNKIEVGIDSDNDGMLNSNEVTSTQYICNKRGNLKTFRYEKLDGAEYNIWTEVLYVDINYTKKSNSSNLKVTWNDTFRTISSTSGGGGACGWKLTFNDLDCSPSQLLLVQHSNGNYPADTHMSSSVTQVCEGMISGVVRIKLLNKRRDGDEDCYRGHSLSLSNISDGSYPASIIVEEIEP